MDEFPVEGKEITAYGENYPAALITVFGGNSPTGKLPVDVYAVDDNSKYTDEILYKLGSGLTYTTISTTSLGDVDMDGETDAADASMILMEYSAIMNGRNYFTSEQKKIADINGDNEIDASDASLVLGYYSYLMNNGKEIITDWIKK